jgi:hypothetical protein
LLVFIKLYLAKTPSRRIEGLIYEFGEGVVLDSRLERGGLVNSHRHEGTTKLVAKDWQAQLSRSFTSAQWNYFVAADQAAKS